MVLQSPREPDDINPIDEAASLAKLSESPLCLTCVRRRDSSRVKLRHQRVLIPKCRGESTGMNWAFPRQR
jgi:hypothetical protein